MEILTTIQSALDKIPTLIGTIRELIIKILTALNLPAESSMIVFFVIAFVLAYFYLKSFIISGWMKISTILNLVLLALLIFLVLTKVG